MAAPEIRVIHSDDALLVVDKPAGLLTYAPPGSSDPTRTTASSSSLSMDSR